MFTAWNVEWRGRRDMRTLRSEKWLREPRTNRPRGPRRSPACAEGAQRVAECAGSPPHPQVPEAPMERTATRIAGFGSSTARPGSPAWTLSHDLGAELARAGATVMTGGYGGIMEACSQGANEAGGMVIGVTVELF